MRHGDFLHSLERLRASSDIVNGVKNVGTIIPCAASIADADDNVFKDDKSFLVLEGLPFDFLWTNGSFAVLAPITVDEIVIGLC